MAHELLHYFGIPMQINHYPSMYKLVRKCVCEPGAGEVFEKGQENKEAMKKWNICSGKISNFFSQKGDPVYACIDHCFPDLETGSHGHVHNCDNFKEEKISPYNFEKMYTQILPNSKCEGEERWQEYGQSHYQKKIIKLFWKQYEKQRYKVYRREKKVDGFQEEIIRATLSKIKKDPKFKKWLKLQSLYESKSKQQNLQTLFHENTSPLFFVIYMNNPAFLKSLRKENVKTNIQLNGVSPLEFLLERHSSEGGNTVEMKKLLLAPQSAFEEPKDSGFKLRN